MKEGTATATATTADKTTTTADTTTTTATTTRATTIGAETGVVTKTTVPTNNQKDAITMDVVVIGDVTAGTTERGEDISETTGTTTSTTTTTTCQE